MFKLLDIYNNNNIIFLCLNYCYYYYYYLKLQCTQAGLRNQGTNRFVYDGGSQVNLFNKTKRHQQHNAD